MNNPYRLDYPSFRYVKVRDVRSPFKEGVDNAGIDFYVPKDLTFEQLKRDNKIGCLTAIYDIEKLGHKYYMPAIRKRQDWGLFLSLLRDCHTAHAIKEPMAYYRNRQNSVSSNKLGLIKYNILIYQKVLGFSKLKSHLYFFCLFTPTHLIKILKRSIDSLIYKIRK